MAKKKAKSKAKKPAKKAARKPAKKAAAKKPAKKPAKRTAKKAKKAAKPAKNLEKLVEGGVFLGEVQDFFTHVGVVALTLEKPLAVGDSIRIKGHTTDTTQKVESMQIDHKTVQAAVAKDAVGIKIVERARKGDFVYKV